MTIQKAIMKLTNDGTTDRTSDIYDAERRQGEEEEEEEEKEGEERIVLASDADAAENRISRPNYRERERERDRCHFTRWARRWLGRRTRRDGKRKIQE